MAASHTFWLFFDTNWVARRARPFYWFIGWVANAPCVYAGWFLNKNELIVFLAWWGWGISRLLMYFVYDVI